VRRMPDEKTPGERLLVGLSRIGTVLRNQAWRETSPRGMNPTQAQSLAFLARSQPLGARLTELADQLAVTQSTASESVSALERKGLVERTRDPADGRAIRITLTETGRSAAAGVEVWPDLLLEVVEDLDAQEQGVLLRLILKMIRGLQVRGEIPPHRMCVTCTHFRPHVHDDPELPHHCAFVDAPFGDRQLRVDCLEHAPAGDAEEATWSAFVSRG